MDSKRLKHYFAGLDLGQSKDFSALAVIERTGAASDDHEYNCVFLKRWQLRTSYPSIVSETVSIMNSPEMQAYGEPVIVVDATGVGTPVVDLFRSERMKADLKTAQITSGADETHENGTYRVPKRNLVSVIQVPLQQGRLKVASMLPEASTLAGELQNFQVRVISDSASDTYGAWREGTHDDLVLAVALALWAAGSWKPRIIVNQPNYFSQTCY